jgi:predicted ATPase
MRLTTLKVSNFRALADVEVVLKPRCNVVVGPNAIGKTTLLDAIRLTKSLLAARTQSESSQILNSLGATSPHNPSNFFPQAIANDPTVPIVIHCGFQFTEGELQLLGSPAALVAMATQSMLGSLGRQFSAQSDLIALLSSEEGRQKHNEHFEALKAAVMEIKSGVRECNLILHIDPKTAQITSGEQPGAAMIGFLDRRLPPGRTVFSYFPADRAIPTQEQPVQIGLADAASQLESHNAQPQLKYSRLKNTIFNAVVAGKAEEQARQFTAIFTHILKGRTLLGVGVSDQGMLKIEVQDDDTKRTFGIEAMSSGEKGLILTCLIIAQTMASGGIVLLDEPELHLNPAVCKEVLNFLIDEYAVPNDLQLIICSHSPEILGVAFDRDDSELYHLISGSMLTPVRKQDLEEVGNALRRLGASQGESLLYRGTVFVEGDHDSDILQHGFRELFHRYMIRDLGGRKNIEREVQVLQAEENKSARGFKTFFILDKDDEPTSLKPSKSVSVLQWKRRCLENYLIDFNALTDISKDASLASKPITNIALMQQTLKRLAMTQLDEVAFWAVYRDLGFANISVTGREIRDKTFAELGQVLFTKAKSIKANYLLLEEQGWSERFEHECEAKKRSMAERWEVTWADECNGKRLLQDIHSELKIKESVLKLKLRIVAGMRANSTENWLTMNSLLTSLMRGID